MENYKIKEEKKTKMENKIVEYEENYI